MNAQHGQLRWPLEIARRGIELNGPYALVVARSDEETDGWYITRDVTGHLPTIGAVGRVIVGRPTDLSSVLVVPAGAEEATAFFCWLDYTRYMRSCQARLLADLLPEHVIGKAARKLPKRVTREPAVGLTADGTRTIRIARRRIWSRRRIWAIDGGVRVVESVPTPARLALIRALEAAITAVNDWMDHLDYLSTLAQPNGS